MKQRCTVITPPQDPFQTSVFSVGCLRDWTTRMLRGCRLPLYKAQLRDRAVLFSREKRLLKSTINILKYWKRSHTEEGLNLFRVIPKG